MKTGKRHKKPLSFFSVFVYIKRSARFQENRRQTGMKIRKCVYSIRRYRNMKWNRFTLKTKTEAEDIVICTLAEVGI